MALELAGVPITGHYFSDIEPYANQIYQKNYPEAVGLGDIHNIDGKSLPKGSWIITGGFPCQDISTAGRRAGIGGSRSGLWWEMHRLIDELRPQAVLVENVSALASSGLERVLFSLADIGYDAEWQTISAAAVGAPHLRKRVWIAAYPQSVRHFPDAKPHQNGRALGACHKLDGTPDGKAVWTSGQRQEIEAQRTFRAQPLVSGMDDGLPGWMDRIRCLGNAIVPQVAAAVLVRMKHAGLFDPPLSLN